MNYLDTITTRRQAIAAVRSEADSIIEQLERIARGWDRGTYRSDDVHRDGLTIRQALRESARTAFAISAKFAQADEAAQAINGGAHPVDAIYALDIVRTPTSGAAVRWYFDSRTQHAQACELCKVHAYHADNVGIVDAVPADDFITSACELRTWLIGDN